MVEPANIFARLQNATESELRTVLAALCADSDNTQKRTATLLDRLDRGKQDRTRQGLLPSTHALHICLNCKQAYNDRDNISGACHYHPGEY
jgi:hypothetical protein